MERLLEEIAKLDLEALLRGVPLDPAKIPPDKVRVLCALAAHCILNGPVGVNKNTNFPTGEVGTIKALIGVPVTNSSWRELCRLLAAEMVKRDQFRPAIAACSSVRRNGKVWPLT